jgi:hypothetical protein
MLFASLMAHFLFFFLFTFSFGRRSPGLGYPSVNFLGSFLSPHDLVRNFSRGDKIVTLGKQDAFLPKTNGGPLDFPIDYYRKPIATLVSREEKVLYVPRESSYPAVLKRKESVVTLYPPLPYRFLLYFKDRQRAHIELEFFVRPGAKASSVALRRKISSGNLEADLLSMRYIGHYLFAQTAYLPAGSWQTIKIDLEPKKEQ